MDTDNKKTWEERLREAGAQTEAEVKRLMQYLDQEVLPDVRRHSSTALRAASEQLAKLAQQLDDTKNKSDL
jgi:glutamyl-tRNA reductase